MNHKQKIKSQSQLTSHNFQHKPKRKLMTDKFFNFHLSQLNSSLSQEYSSLKYNKKLWNTTMTEAFNASFFFSILSLLPLSLFSNSANAQMTGVVPDSVILSIDCSVDTCLTSPNIKETTFGAPYFACNGFAPDGTCNTVYGNRVYGNEPLAVNTASINHLISIEASNPTKKTVGFKDCISIAGGNSQCTLIISTYTFNPSTSSWEWINSDSSTPNQTDTARSPQNCPYSGVYLWSQGCMVNGYTSGGITYITTTTSPVGGNSCEDNSCKTSEVQLAQNSTKPIVGNPVDITSGAKFDKVNDIIFPLPFSRTYSSSRKTEGSLGLGMET